MSGRVRYAHTAPWHVSINGKPPLPRAEERDYLARRVETQIERSKSILPPEAIEACSRPGTRRATYVVVEVPEAIWSNLGLTYLAHTHIDTIWDRQGMELPPLEWIRHSGGELTHHRTLPNGIVFGAKIVAQEKHVEMELWLTNGTAEKLTGLRVQTCVMLKGSSGFSAQSNWNKRLRPPFAAAHSDDGRRWIITAWENCQRVWANPPVPCVHSNPKFPDLGPGETGRLKGWLWFHEGDDLEKHLKKLEATLL